MNKTIIIDEKIPDTSLIYSGGWIDPDHFIYKEKIYERCLNGTVVFIAESKDFREKGGDS